MEVAKWGWRSALMPRTSGSYVFFKNAFCVCCSRGIGLFRSSRPATSFATSARADATPTKVEVGDQRLKIIIIHEPPPTPGPG